MALFGDLGWREREVTLGVTRRPALARPVCGREDAQRRAESPACGQAARLEAGRGLAPRMCHRGLDAARHICPVRRTAD